MEPPGGGPRQRAAPDCLGGRARPEGGSVGPGLGTGGRGWRDSTEPDPGLLLIQRPAVSRRCLRRTGGVATTDRSGQRGHGSPQGLRAPGECGRRRALGWRFAVERISPRQAGEGRRPCALGSVYGSRSPWPVRPSWRKTGSTGPLCCVTAPAQELLWTGAGPAWPRLGASPEDGLFLPRLTRCHPSTEPRRHGG